MKIEEAPLIAPEIWHPSHLRSNNTHLLYAKVKCMSTNSDSKSKGPALLTSQVQQHIAIYESSDVGYTSEYCVP